jgi:type II secretory pathway pseudopilin PulG
LRSRNGVSIIETLVVIAIIGLMLGFLFPAIQTARLRALELVCKNNLRQINLAVASYYEAQRRLPPPPTPGLVGGWTIEVLPFLEQQNLQRQIVPGTPVASALAFLLRQPTIMTCPVPSEHASAVKGMDRASYVMSARRGAQPAYSLFDAPLDSKFPWASGPVMDMTTAIRQTGPHNHGFFYTGGFDDGVSFIPGEQ